MAKKRRRPRLWESPGPGQPDPRVPYAIAIAVGSLGVFGQFVIYAQQMQGDLTPGVLLILFPNVLAGIVAMFGTNPLSSPVNTDSTRRAALTGAGLRSILVVLVVDAVQVLLGLPAAIRLAIVGPFHDPSVVLAPLALALVSAFGGFAGLLICLMVLWPIVMLVHALVDRALGRRTEAGVIPGALLFLLIIVTGITAVAAPHAELGTGPSKYRGGVLLLSTWFIYSGTPAEQALAWTTRVLEILIVLDVVWLVRQARKPKESEPTSSPV